MSRSIAERSQQTAAAAPPGASARDTRRLRSLLLAFARALLPPFLALALAAGIWEAWVRLRDVPEYLVPAPSAIAGRLAEDPTFFARQGFITLYGALGGFGLGVGLMPKLFITALIVFFPVMVNAVVGFRSVNPWALELLHSLAASPWGVFLKLRLPSSLPYLFAAFKVSIPLSVIGAVVAEWFSGQEGLGRVIQVSDSNLDMPTAFGAIISLAVLGIGLYLITSFLERRLLAWHQSALRVG